MIRLRPNFSLFLMCQQMILKCQPWLSFGSHFSLQMFLLMQHLPLWRMECAMATDLTTCALPLQPYGARILVPRSNYFQSCDLMSVLHSTHRNEEHKALHPLFLCQSLFIHNKAFNKAFSFQGEVGLAL